VNTKFEHKLNSTVHTDFKELEYKINSSSYLYCEHRF